MSLLCGLIHAGRLRPCRSTVLARIEGCIRDAVECIAHGQLPELELVSRAAGNTHMVADGGALLDEGGGGGGDAGGEWAGPEGGTTGDAGAPESDVLLIGSEAGGEASGDEGEGAGQRPRQRRRRQGQGARLRLGSLTQTKSMTRGQGRQAQTVARGGCDGEHCGGAATDCG